MTPSRKNICKSLARGSHAALARQCLDNALIRQNILSGLCRIIRREISKLCSNASCSILLDKSSNTLKSFKWESLLGELEKNSPTLLAILNASTSSRSNPQKSTVGLIAAILMKNRRKDASLLQRLLSIILYSGHASKRVMTYIVNATYV